MARWSIEPIERLALEEGLLKGIAVALKLKFGAAGTKLLPKIQKLHDCAKLEALLQGIESFKTVEEIKDAFW